MVDGEAAIDVFAVDGGFPKSSGEIFGGDGSVDEYLGVLFAKRDRDFLAIDEDFSARWRGWLVGVGRYCCHDFLWLRWLLVGSEKAFDALEVWGYAFGVFFT